MSQESVLGLQGVAENGLESGRWPSDEPEALNGSSHGHEHDDIEEEDEHPMADGAETELELGDGEDATVKVTRKPGPPPMIDTTNSHYGIAIECILHEHERRPCHRHPSTPPPTRPYHPYPP